MPSFLPYTSLPNSARYAAAVQPVGVLCMKAHTLAKGKRVIQRLGHAVSEGLFLIPPGHRFNGQQLLQRLQQFFYVDSLLYDHHAPG